MTLWAEGYHDYVSHETNNKILLSHISIIEYHIARRLSKSVATLLVKTSLPFTDIRMIRSAGYTSTEDAILDYEDGYWEGYLQSYFDVNNISVEYITEQESKAFTKFKTIFENAIDAQIKSVEKSIKIIPVVVDAAFSEEEADNVTNNMYVSESIRLDALKSLKESFASISFDLLPKLSDSL